MTLTLYRVTSPGDNIGNVGITDIIIFNNTANVNSHNAFITEFNITNTTGIGNNQAAEQDLGDHQDLGSVEQLYIITGFISLRTQAEASTNFITILKWVRSKPYDWDPGSFSKKETLLKCIILRRT